jgi:hypothetical protein
MGTAADGWKPTARLRFVERPAPTTLDKKGKPIITRILQQFWAPNMPSYMADPSVGEWRDVEVGVEAP